MLPPLDPSEPGGPPPEFSVGAPTTMFLKGAPSRPGDQIADAILTARPGLLVVCVDL